MVSALVLADGARLESISRRWGIPVRGVGCERVGASHAGWARARFLTHPRPCDWCRAEPGGKALIARFRADFGGGRGCRGGATSRWRGRLRRWPPEYLCRADSVYGCRPGGRRPPGVASRRSAENGSGLDPEPGQDAPGRHRRHAGSRLDAARSIALVERPTVVAPCPIGTSDELPAQVLSAAPDG